MKRMVIVLIVIMCGIFLVTRSEKDSQAKQGTSATYQGKIDGYDVEISETKKDVVSLIVHLYPLDEAGVRSTDATLRHFTGHRTGTKGDWDRIFFCGMPDSKNGCNAFENRGGEYVWSPCDRERGSQNPFSVGEVVGLLRRLDQALIAVHNREHKVAE